MNKILLALGSITIVAIPFVMLISCSSKTSEEISISHKVIETNFNQKLLDKLNSIVNFGIKKATFKDNLRVSGARKVGEITIKFVAAIGNVLDIVGIGPGDGAIITLSPSGTNEDPTRVKVSVNGHRVNDQNPIISKLVKELIPAIESYQETKPNDKKKT